MGKILIKNGIVVDVENRENTGIMDVLIENDTIVEVKKGIEEKECKVIDATGNIILPGFINTHTHIAMNFFKGYAQGYNLMEWLNKKIWPVEDRLNEDDIYKSSLSGILEMIKTGTTTFLDMYFGVESTIKAIKQSKIRACISRCIMNTKDYNDIRIRETYDLIKKYGNDKEELLTFMVGPHSLYVCDKETLIRCVNIAKENNIGLHIHLAETQDEIKIIKDKYNMTPFELLKSVGAFDVPVVLAHCVYATDNDIEIIKGLNGGISHNPVSNSSLGSGIAPIYKYLKNNINVSLGTDGSSSTPSLDMFLEMKMANYLQKATMCDSTCIDAYTTLQMATINGAKTLGMQDKIGSIKVGKKADIIIIDGKSINLNPLNDIYSNLVYCASGCDVITSIINGNIIMQNRKILTFNEEETIKNCNLIAKKLLED